MKPSHEAPSPSVRERLLSDLAAVREETKIELRLLSLEAADRRRELESKVSLLEARLNHTGEEISTSVERAVDDMSRELKAFFKKHSGTVI